MKAIGLFLPLVMLASSGCGDDPQPAVGGGGAGGDPPVGGTPPEGYVVDKCEGFGTRVG